MSTYVLDSDVVMDFLRAIEPATGFLSRLSSAGHDLVLTAVTACEVFSGILPRDRAAVAATLAQFRPVDLTPQMGNRAGEYRYDFARRGQRLATPDTFNAAAAHALGATLVTRNRRHFPMADVTVVSPN